MSVPRGKKLNRLKVEDGLKSLNVRDEMAHVPITLYKFTTTKASSGHPIFPFRPTINDSSLNVSPQAKELSPDVFRSSPYLGELFKPDIFRKTAQANKVLKNDKELSRIDFSKKVSDVSYLMETKSYIKEAKTNEHNASLIKRSIDLLSPKRQMNLTESSFLNATQSQDEKVISRREAENIYLEMKEYGKEESVFFEGFAKNKLAYQTEQTPERKRQMNRSIDAEYPIFNRTLPKIVHPAKLESGIDLTESPTKDDVKNNFMLKVKKGIIVQKRAQNKNLLVPSGRKEVVSLSEWLTEMLEGVQKTKSLGVNEILGETQSIYTVCLEEIIRQVKIQCSERGQLLEKIWEAYMSLFNMAIEVTQKEQKKLEESHQDEIKNLSLKYEDEIHTHILNLETASKEREETNALLEKETELRSLLEGRTDRLTKELFNLKHDFHKAQNEIQVWRNNQQFETSSFNGRNSFRVNNSDRKPSIQVSLNIKGAEGKMGIKDKEMTMTEEQSDLTSSYEPSAENLNEYLNIEDRFRDIELDTADLEDFIKENEHMLEEKLNKSVQWEEQDIEREKEQEEQEQKGQNEDEEEEREVLGQIEDQQDQGEDKKSDESKIGSSNEESEQDTESVQSTQEVMQILNSKEIMVVREGLDKLTQIELKEIQREVQERLVQTDRIESKENKRDDDESSPFARRNSSKKSTVNSRRNKKKHLNSEARPHSAMQATTKEDVIGVLEKYQGDNVRHSLNEVSTEDEIILFMTKFLKGDQEWKLQDLQSLIKKVTNRKAYSLDLEQETWNDEEGPAKILKSLTGEQLSETVRSLEHPELAKILEDFEKRFEKSANGNIESANNQEVIDMLQTILEEREDVVPSTQKSLLQKILKAYKHALNKNMELKIENKENEIDLKELRDQQERHENTERNLHRQVNEWQERNQHLLKMNEHLNKTLAKTKLVNQEANTKTLKPGSLVNEHISGQGLDDKDNNDDPGSTTERGRRRAQIAKGITIVNTLQEGIDEPQREPNTGSLNMIENLADTMKVPNTEGEEDWSDSDAKTERTVEGEDRKAHKRSSQRTLSFFARQPRKTIFLSRPPGEGLKPKRILRVTSINGESANALLAKTKEKKNLKSSITKQTLLKFIAQFYVEKLKETKKLSPLHISVYDSFMNKYGLKKVAETKCLQIFESAVAFSYQNKRIERFKDLLGLGESFEVVEELELYLSVLRQLDTSSNGVLIASNTQEKMFITLEQAETVTINIFESKLDPQSLRELLINLQQLKSIDRVSRVLELEDLVDKLFHTQRNLQNTVKGFVKEIFNATDLDNDETIEIFEFNILYRQLEKERYDKKQVRDLFFEHADLVLPDGSNEPVLSFNKFAWICLEMKLFSEDKQKLFARVPIPSDPIQNVKDLEQDIKQKLNEIRLRFMKSQSYTPQVKGIMAKLYSSVKNPIKSRNVVWLSYRLLDEESKSLLDEESKSQLLDYEMNMMLPKEFGIMQRFADEMDGWIDHLMD